MTSDIEKHDIEFEKEDVTLLVDQITLDFISGSKINFNEEMIRSSFEIEANPNASLSCSCGTSFSPKE